ncbi:ATP-binding protein [Rhodococcus sp. AD45-ID]|uniref:sacsin N-terminal ATP-binding-like domain-containing protein n=1 Tax=unclassified Rhodococcus (in: high G+C Gram-positive bacteria) TaxID=192944 RepID=UPI00069607A1|nr:MULTISPECIES: molecular chaperone Hsp90 [unclassified Rhodococcus (in: high G+C Gram-positive bacteria)]PSR38699.1 ATP-binding protein [Rhodococcus sp. AD45-ID]
MREDAATESDLAAAGYRDRLLTELAQNAADAALRAGAPGSLWVDLDGSVLTVANTGRPLDEDGVHALTALRASGKIDSTDGVVGRYGVGFSAVRSVSDELELRSTSGSIRFSAKETRSEIEKAGLKVPESGVPALRLVWPSEASPRAGADSEVVLTLRDDVDGGALLSRMAREAVDLLLELPGLTSIRLGDKSFERTERLLDSGLTEISIGTAVWWQYQSAKARWIVPVKNGVVAPVTEDVLRAPTRSDEELSVPALVVADIAMQPDRRRILPGASIAALAGGYADFVGALPADQRTSLVPVPAFARSEVDSLLREALLKELQENAWLPVVGEPDRAPQRASVVPGLTDDLAELLTDVIGGLVVPELSGPRHERALAAVSTHRIGLARIAELLSGLDQEPSWWYRLYAALEPLVVDALAVEELGTLPVPLSDGRIVTGPRTVVLGTELGDSVPPVPWTRLVHPQASHPLLSRLGATSATATDLLSDPALRALIEDAADQDDSVATELASTVLSLAAHVAPGAAPSWIGEVLLPDSDGELCSADQLLLPGAPLATVLVDDSPFGTVQPSFVEQVGEQALRVVGVGWGFTVVREELPSGPDHDLDSESQWWDTLGEDPEYIEAVRDLDLVDENRWADALTLLLESPATRTLLEDRRGYTAWWLRSHAELGGEILGLLRAPHDRTFEDLLDVADHPGSEYLSSVLASDTVDDPELAQLLLDRLADPLRMPAPAVIARTHHLLADASRRRVLDLDELSLPSFVRGLSGELVDPGDALVLDRPWLGPALPTQRIVLGSFETAEALADLLDVATASSVVGGQVVSTGVRSSWAAQPHAVLMFAALGREVPGGEVVIHHELSVRLTGAVEATVSVPWWVDGDGIHHVMRVWAAAQGI